MRRLIIDVQDGVPLSAGEVRQLVADAERRGWPDVAMLGLCLEIVRCEVERGRPDPQAIAELLERATAEQDLAMTAMALAFGARAAISFERSSPVAADRDLARAAVLLESIADASGDTATAHIECARAYSARDLWELELEHYTAAGTSPRDQDEQLTLLPVVRFNQVETQLNWLMALKELGETGALSYRAAAVGVALVRAQIPTMPASWLLELRIFAQLLAAIAPSAARPEWLAIDAPAEGVYAGHVHLSRALSARDPPAALEQALAAVSSIDAVVFRSAHNLALCVCAEAEQAIAGRQTAGLRYARHLARLRWEARSAALASARSMRQAEQLRSEHTILSQHVYLDDLTQLGNRRALARHLEGLVTQRIGSVAIVAIDVDQFKAVNDSRGHVAGDQTLIRVAEVLRAAVRSGDLAVRVGGDEFLLLLPSTQIDVARQRAQAILAQLGAEPWEQLSPSLCVTVSAGIAAGDPGRHRSILVAADAALYEAKAAGGNTVCVA